MAKLSLILSAALIVLVAMAFVIETSQAGGEGSVKLKDCPKACGVRCSATSHKSACTFFCNYCCKRCLCVPSGTYGHKDECKCYRDMKTKEGKPKCP
ncbi:Gibberellin regulated protein [Salix suchowensis]|nr:Gibberellin regulated protein [Salix suchowensis]